MSADVLRDAAERIRKYEDIEEQLGHTDARTYTAWLAVADLLDNAANRAGAAFGPKPDDTDADALAVARAYLGESA